MVAIPKSAREFIQQRAESVHIELQKVAALYTQMGVPMPPLTESPWFSVLNRLYADEFPLAKVLDESEFIAHADGPALQNENPRIDIVTWLCGGVQSQTRALTASALNIGARSKAVQAVQFRLTGLAPGSLYAGFSIVRDIPVTTVTHLQLAADDSVSMANSNASGVVNQIDVLGVVKDSMVNLARVSEKADKSHVSEELSEEILDPVQRDASLMAALKLAPTGRNGVHSVHLSTRFAGEDAHSGTLDPTNRAIISDIVKNTPLLASSHQTGSFIGQLRGLDLDKTRVDLRNIPGIGSLRCILRLDADKAGKVIGQWVKVTGEYEVNSSGKPRLIVASDIELAQEPSLKEQLRRDSY